MNADDPNGMYPSATWIHGKSAHPQNISFIPATAVATLWPLRNYAVLVDVHAAVLALSVVYGVMDVVEEVVRCLGDVVLRRRDGGLIV